MHVCAEDDDDDEGCARLKREEAVAQDYTKKEARSLNDDETKLKVFER